MALWNSVTGVMASVKRRRV